MEKKSINKTAYYFVKEIINLTSTEQSKLQENTQELQNLMIQNKYDKFVPYPEITEFVYDEDRHISIEDLGDVLDIYFPKEFSRRFIRHISLAISQKTYFSEQLEEAEAQIEKLQEIKGTIYSEFIAILGIFSALIFGLFGGFDLLTYSFNAFIEMNSIPKSISYLILLSMSLLSLIYFLVYWISKIIERPIAKGKIFLQRHRSFLIILEFSTIILIISLIAGLIELHVSKGWFSFIFTLFFLLIALVVFIALLNTTLKQDEESSRQKSIIQVSISKAITQITGEKRDNRSIIRRAWESLLQLFRKNK